VASLRMTPKVAYFCSLKYSPGLLKEIEQLALRLVEDGWHSRLLLAESYRNFEVHRSLEVRYVTASHSAPSILWDCLRFPYRLLKELNSIFEEMPPDFLCIYNPHPLNGYVASVAQQINPSGVRAVYLHEPFVPDKSSYGLVRAQCIRLVELQQAHMLRRLNCVLLPSEHSLSLYQSHYAANKPAHITPILLDDRCHGAPNREYYSFVGTVNASRSLDEFVQLINRAASLGDLALKFRIVTRSPIESFIRRIAPAALPNVEIVNRPLITDAEIGETLALSKATFLSHKQAAQSGNVPFAFMYGTPIICRDIPGLTQHVHHLANGYVLPLRFTVQQFYQAIQYMEEHWEALGRQARVDYEEIFDIRNWERYYGWLL
jgi:glycosyltransferase involved in cell wall biosynthesis